jgi:secondary thiamine-phosphate synthase enzyme
MKTLTEHLWFNTPNRHDFINITNKVEELVSKSGVKEGLVLVNPMHITASIYINDAESGLINDFQKWLNKLAPTDENLYQHNQTGEVTVAITNGKLDLGPWEQIFYAEFDGQRKKRVLVKIIGE